MKGGFGHVGVSTHDMESTVAFYRDVLGCNLVADETMKIGGGGEIRQVSIDVGAGQYLVFMESKDVEGIEEGYDTSINGALGVPSGMYHSAFKIGTLEELELLAERISSKGIQVSEITDLDTAKAVFLQDPNGLQIELSVKVRDYDESDIGRVTHADVATNEQND